MEKGFSFSTSMSEIYQTYPCRFIAKLGSANGQREAGMHVNYLPQFVTNTVNISTN